MQGLISFIIPVRDRDIERIQNCVNSLRGNHAGEIIIVDYGSKSSISGIEGAKVIRYNKNPIWNKAHAINLGIRAAKYDYIGTVDCDMIIPIDFFRGVDEHINNKSFIYTLNVNRVAQKDVSDDFRAMLEKSSPWHGVQTRRSIVHNANGGIQIYPKRWITEIGGVDESLIYWGGMDNDVFERGGLSGLRMINLNMPIIHQEHKAKKEEHLTGDEKIMALRIRIQKTEYLEEMFKERKYMRNDGCWGLDKPNQKRFAKSIEKMNEEIEKEKKEKEKYAKAMIKAVSGKKSHFWFKGKKIDIFNGATEKQLKLKKEKVEKQLKLKKEMAEKKRVEKEIKRVEKEAERVKKINKKFELKFIKADSEHKKTFIFNGKKVEVFK